MSAILIAQAAAGLTLLHWIVIAIVVIAAVGIALAVAKHSGVAIPAVVWTIAWIVIIAFVAIIAIKLLMQLL